MKCEYIRNGFFRTAAALTSVVLMATLLFGCTATNKLYDGSSQTTSDTENTQTTPGETTTNTTITGGSETTQNNTTENTTSGLTTTSGTTGTTSAQPVGTDIRKICGSFIQPWLVAGWSQERWDEECSNMVKAGMKYIILQSITDLNYNTDNNVGQNPDSYKLSSVDSLYPSNLPELKNANNGVDSLKECLEACKKNGMQAIIGPVSDNRWWLYGWGMPTKPSDATDVVTQSYFTKWTEENADLSNRIADEVISKYGSDYGSQIYCWYYNNEIWNIDTACAGSDDGVYAKILSNSMNLSLRHYTELTPGMPMMLSPFINPSLSSASGCAKMWKDIFALTEFRDGDIFSPQDSFGGNTGLNLDDWWSNYKKAVDSKPGLILWANNECFRSNYTIARLDNFINKQVNVTAKYAAANICFSWNHYYSPLEVNPGYDAAYVDYITNGKLDSTAPTTPVVSVNGTKVTVNSSDNIGICGYTIYKSDQKTIVKSVVCDDTTSWLTRPVSLSSGTYYVSTYDFCGNYSQMTKITIS